MTRLTWQEITECVHQLKVRLPKQLASRIKYIYGIPRGGAFVASLVQAMDDTWTMLELPPWEHNIDPVDVVIVDDIIDSGTTVRPFIVRGYQCDSLFIAKKSPVSSRELAPFANPTISRDWVEFPWEHGTTGPEDAVIRLLQWVGEDPTREGLVETPARVTKALKEMCSGYEMDPKKILSKMFTSDTYDEMIVETPIEFTSMCEHHMLPFVGTCAIGYIPDKKVVGASKLARLVEVFARRLQIQERMTTQIAQTIMETLDCLGVGVVVKAKHACMGCRGVMQRRSSFITSALLGAMREGEVRSEFLTLVGDSLD